MQATFSFIDQILDRKWIFLSMFFLIFTATYGVFFAFDALPEPVSTSTAPVKAAPAAAAPVTSSGSVSATSSQNISGGANTQNLQGELPKTLTIDSLGRTVTVLNPASRTVASLDAALLSGLARHPDSAKLGQQGNIFILGHSSYLPIVHNKSYQAFNGIQNLKWGDTIRLNSATTEYVYRVEKVYKAKASALVIPIAGAGQHLTLATCNSFGSTDDRYIVESTLISTKAL